MARLMANALERIGDGESAASGRWRLNAGSPMLLEIPSLRDGGPVRVILDLASARFAAQRIPALYGHEAGEVIGYWDRASVAEGLDADFHPIEPASEMEAAAMPEAVRVRAQVRAGVPIQASIGAGPGPDGRYEPVSGTVTANGRVYDLPDDGIPSFILRGAVITEASIVTFGADDATGRLAAKLHKEQRNMSLDILKAALAKHPKKHHAMCAALVAEGKTGDEINDAVRAEDDMEKDAELATLREKCAALEQELATLKEKLAAGCGDGGKKDDGVMQAAKGSDKGVAFTAGKADAKPEGDPADLLDGMERLTKAGEKLTGFALRAKARATWPNIPDVSADRIAAARKRFAAG